MRRFFQTDLQARKRNHHHCQRKDVEGGEIGETSLRARQQERREAAAMTAGATLIRNSHCHDQVSLIQPPTTGPIVGASTAITPAIVVATECKRGGNNRNTAENTAGISMPPAKP